MTSEHLTGIVRQFSIQLTKADMPPLDTYNEHVTEDLDRPFAAAGRRCYVIGHMNGSFPDLGHHLPGEMGGIWAQPLKLADGFWFGLRCPDTEAEETQQAWEWLYGDNCHQFTMKPGRVHRAFSIRVGGSNVEAEQELFVPESEPGVLLNLTLRNDSAHDITVVLAWLVRFDIQGAWWSGWPDGPDDARFVPSRGAIVANDSRSSNWCAAMLGDSLPVSHTIGTDLWAAEKTSSLEGNWGRQKGGLLRNWAELHGGGISGQLQYNIELRAGVSHTLHFAIAGGPQGPEKAYQKAEELLACRQTLVASKLARLEGFVEKAASIYSPRPDLDRTFSQQTLCLDMMTVEMPNVGRGCVAGLPGFAWFFGCDTYYTVGGLLISGQSDTALDNLRLLGQYAQRQRGRVPHEITPTGGVFNLGNTVETCEYVTAVERAYRWTGDRSFLDEVYEVCRQGIFDYVLGECDPGGDLLPNGAGLLELGNARHGKKLDVAASLYQALGSLAYLAEAMGDVETVLNSRQLMPRVREQIDRHFWVEERKEYVWRVEQDLSVRAEEPAHSYVALEMGLLGQADAERISALFEKVESPAHTGPEGLIHPGTTSFVMPIQNAIVALAEFRYGRPDKGLWYLERMASLAGHFMPWAIPEFAGGNACFLQAWSSAAYNWLIVQGLFRLNPNPLSGTIAVQPQLPQGWSHFEARSLCIWGDCYNLHLRRTPEGVKFTVEQPGRSVPRSSFKVTADPLLPASFV